MSSVSKPVSRSVFPSVHRPTNVPAALLGGVTPFTLPAALTEYWIAGSGMWQDSGMTQPVTAAGQTVAKWVGQRAGNVLTGTNVVAQSINGVLVPKLNALDAYFDLPGGWSTNKRDFSFQFHCQQSGCGQRAQMGLGTTRQGEFFNYESSRITTYDGTTVGTVNLMPKLSNCTVHIRGNASGLKGGVNGAETSLTAWSAGSLTGGRIGDLAASSGVGGFKSNMRLWGISAGPYLDDATLTQTLAAWQGYKAIPSETAPQENWLIYGDSHTEGYKTTTLETWATIIADTKPNIRIGHFGWAGAYFIGGVDSAANASQGATEKVTGVTNRVIFCGTNDFYTSTAAAYFAAVKARGQAMQASGWKAWVWKMPQRASPYTDSDPAFNGKVNTFNASLVSDPWMDGVIDVATIADAGGAKMSDGVHFTSATQTAIANYVKTLWSL